MCYASYVPPLQYLSKTNKLQLLFPKSDWNISVLRVSETILIKNGIEHFMKLIRNGLSYAFTNREPAFHSDAGEGSGAQTLPLPAMSERRLQQNGGGLLLLSSKQ